MFPRVLRHSSSAARWNTKPISRCGPFTGWPSSSARPREARTSPAATLSSVDLPQPDGPRIETNSPGATSSETPATASVVFRRVTKRTATSSKRTAAVAGSVARRRRRRHHLPAIDASQYASGLPGFFRPRYFETTAIVVSQSCDVVRRRRQRLRARRVQQRSVSPTASREPPSAAPVRRASPPRRRRRSGASPPLPTRAARRARSRARAAGPS